MWIWIIIGAGVLGAIIGMFSSDDKPGEGAAQGAMAGGCLAAGCLFRIAMAALVIFAIIWLFGALFG